MSALAEFEYLWTVELANHVLIRLGGDAPSYVIFETTSQTALVIEDDETHRKVVDRLLEAGVAVVDRVPGAGPPR